MKKFAKIKRIGLMTTVALLCLAMLITCFTFVKPFGMTRALAEEAGGDITVSGESKLLQGKTVQSEVEYGGTITIPAAESGVTVSVTAPNGDDVDASSGEVVANQMGVYKIKYSDSAKNVSYVFNVKVTLDEDYFLWVDYNGADIPTYLQADKSFTIPVAKLMYYNDNNILTEFDGAYTVTVKDSLGHNHALAQDGKSYGQFSAEKGQKVFLTYSAQLGTDGTKYYTKTFPINVQSKVNNSGNPQLSVSGVQKDASVNRPVTLPVAKATDTNDDNVKVVIEVYEPDGKTLVKNVEVDDDGYAVKQLESDVVFDNDKSMTFYPTQTGAYKVKYTAYNDYNAIDPNSGKSGTSEFTVTVADHVAPVFKNVDEYLIPETWGTKVTNKDGEVSDKQNKITFTVPEVVDNKDHAKKIDPDDTDLISVYFRITDSDNSRTILEITNILDVPYNKDDADTASTKNKGTSDVYDGDITFTEDGFTFDFSKYTRKDKKGEEMDSYAGTYTVLYRARDKANNTSSKTYTITMKDEYEDKAEPNSAEVTAPEYLSAADESFTVPYPVYSDANDSRPYLVYRVYTDAEGAEPNYIDVEGGEEAELKDGKLVIGDEELTLGENLYFYVYVEDKAGNYISNADNLKYDAITAENMSDITAVTKIIGETDMDNVFAYHGEKVEFTNKKDGGKAITAGDTVSAGSFNIEVKDFKMRAYTGFEVAVTDPYGNPVAVTLETVSVPNADRNKATIYVQNIFFTATNSTVATGEEEETKYYTMTVRVFDVNGVTDVYGYSFTGVTAKKGNTGSTSATPVIGSSGSVNTKYKLHNEVIKGIPEGDYFVARKISGGTFSLMGSEFVAMVQYGDYSVQDFYIGYADQNDGKGLHGSEGSYTFDMDTDITDEQKASVYNFQIKDTATPVIELQGVMPNYSEKDEYVVLPKSVAYTENGMGVIEIEVKDPDSYDVDLEDDEATGAKKFKATKDGVYTVVYTATYKNASPATSTYRINVGDVFAPIFVTEGGTSTVGTLREGDTFVFATLKLVEDDESTTGLTITKEIYDPKGDIMSSCTVSGSYSGYADKGNNGSEITLTNVGDYKIVYTVKDAVGNEYKLTDKITVVSEGSSSPTTWTTLSTVLIIVAIVLLAGVIIYVVRFRKVKK